MAAPALAAPTPRRVLDDRLTPWRAEVDRWSLGAVVAIIAFGVIAVFAASPPVATRLGLDGWHFAIRHLTFLPVALLLIVGLSMTPPIWLRRLALVGLLGALVLLAATLIAADDVKGARRWIALFGFSLQPSEFVKPFLAVVTAWLFARAKHEPRFPGERIAGGLLIIACAMLALQPDIGMASLIAMSWLAQLFLGGLPMIWAVAAGVVLILLLIGAYYGFDHVASRIDHFFDPSSGDTFQIDQAMRAFDAGGLLGVGPGEGEVKARIPDAHADFVFAVAAEEFGFLLCAAVIALFAIVAVRGLRRAAAERDLFIALAAAGLAVQFGAQALVNFSSTLGLLPTKGMTLPFVSYGGSSLLASAITVGMLLGFTRARPRTASDGRG
ncbi:MAG: putative peptidoglycan glycosyltransferase FtsW [Pseudomonadota bacterium]